MKKLIYLLLTVILTSVVFANFEVQVTPVRDNIYLDENAHFKLIIYNQLDKEDLFQIYSSEYSWYVETEPSIIRVSPESDKTLEMLLIPSVWTEVGPQKVKIAVESSETSERKLIDVPLYVRQFSPFSREYSPSIELRVSMRDEVDPRIPLAVQLYLRNRNRLDIHELQIGLSSNLLGKEMIVPFSGLEERTEEFIFNLDPLTPPQEDELQVTLWIGNKTVNKVKKQYKITSYSDMVVEKEIREELFRKIEDITIKNVGNIGNSKKYYYPIHFFQKLFVKSQPRLEQEDINGEDFLVWDITLQPNQEAKLRVTTNYRSVLYIILILVLVIIMYYIYRSPVVVKKEVLVIGSPEEGISEMKIVIYLRNRTQEIIENLTIVDKIPSLAELIKESYVGTLEPTRILHHDKKGTLLKWELKSLEPFEERIITYRIRSKLSILGGIHLPQTKVKFDTKQGRERVIYSNRCEVRINFG
ncbi:hypothetical protein JW930_07055 [Candidatus Woesearchaeota archaeon]|nr:hypothetical protein [Candidatus Woesearchaeota archaeon]